MGVFRFSIFSCVLAACAFAVGQEKPGSFGLSIGYFSGNQFQNRVGRNNRLQGFEIAGDLTLAQLNNGAGDFRLVPSVVFGNNAGGSSVSGNIYRLGVKFVTHQPGQKFYFHAGAGYAWTQELGRSNFSEHNGIAGFLGVGYQFAAPTDGKARPYLEATYHVGHEQVSGLSLMLGVRF